MQAVGAVGIAAGGGPKGLSCPAPRTPQVASARVIGGPAAAQLTHGAAPPLTLPLPANSFAGAPAAGAWNLRSQK
jgi:hypothetical protein